MRNHKRRRSRAIEREIEKSSISASIRARDAPRRGSHERARVEKEIADQRKGRARRSQSDVAKKQDEYTLFASDAHANRYRTTPIWNRWRYGQRGGIERTGAKVASLNSIAKRPQFDDEKSANLWLKRAGFERGRLPLPSDRRALQSHQHAHRDAAVAEAPNSACAACFMALRPQVMARCVTVTKS